MYLAAFIDLGEDETGFSVKLSRKSQTSGINKPDTAVVIIFYNGFVSMSEYDNVCFVLHCLIKKPFGSVIYAFAMSVYQKEAVTFHVKDQFFLKGERKVIVSGNHLNIAF